LFLFFPIFFFRLRLFSSEPSRLGSGCSRALKSFQIFRCVCGRFFVDPVIDCKFCGNFSLARREISAAKTVSSATVCIALYSRPTNAILLVDKRRQRGGRVFRPQPRPPASRPSSTSFICSLPREREREKESPCMIAAEIEFQSPLAAPLPSGGHFARPCMCLFSFRFRFELPFIFQLPQLKSIECI